MVSGKRQMSYRALMLLAAVLLGGCTFRRTYVGPEIIQDPYDVLVNGVSTKADVLRLFGPPVSMQRQFDGDLFVYAYRRENFSELTLREPIVTRMPFFTYSRTQDKADRLVILFDKDGVVREYAIGRGTGELKAF